jgi:hypothetical protein
MAQSGFLLPFLPRRYRKSEHLSQPTVREDLMMYIQTAKQNALAVIQRLPSSGCSNSFHPRMNFYYSCHHSQRQPAQTSVGCWFSHGVIYADSS